MIGKGYLLHNLYILEAGVIFLSVNMCGSLSYESIWQGLGYVPYVAQTKLLRHFLVENSI